MLKNRPRARVHVKPSLQLLTPGFHRLLLHCQRYPLLWLVPVQHRRKFPYAERYGSQRKELVNFALQSVNEFSYFCSHISGVRRSESRVSVNVDPPQNETPHEFELLKKQARFRRSVKAKRIWVIALETANPGVIGRISYGFQIRAG